jgi:MFS family permease
MDSVRKYTHSTFASLKIRNYRLFFIGQSVSMCGTWMQTVAMGWLTLELTGSGTSLGGMLAAQFLPILLLGPWGGVLVDRYNKRTLLLVTQILTAVLSLVLGLFVIFGVIQVWSLYVFAALFGLIKVVDNPARSTFVNELVGPSHIRNAVTLNSIVNNLARLVGPAICGMVIVLFGIGWSFMVNALSFVVVIVMLVLIHDHELTKEPPTPKSPGQIREGLAYVQSNPIVRDTLLLMVIMGTLSYEFQVSLPLLAKITFLGDASSYATLMSAMGAGAVLGGLYTAGRKAVAMQQLAVFSWLFGLSMIVVGLMPNFFTATLGMLVVGFFSVNVIAMGNTLLQLNSVSHMRGRVMALWSMAFLGTTPLGGPIIGFVGEFLGPRYTMFVGGAAAVVAAIYIYRLLDKYHISETESEEESESAIMIK